MRLCLPLLLLALSCRTGEKAQSDTAGLGDGAAIDADGDGFAGDEDCDDTDATVNGGATEVCDGIDNNCDGSIDEGVGLTGFFDRDGDSFGDPDAPTEACDLPSGVVSNANDCDDDNPDAYPGAIEICNDIDDDCDGRIDEDLLYTFYLDLDGDGYGDPDAPIEACEAPEGSSGNALDCDDSDDTVSPGAVEVCNEVDDDCDGDIDEDVTLTYYLDADGDGWGGDGATVEACDLPMGYASRTGDCDDADIAFFPGAPEPDCTDPNDYNCDGSVAWADDDGDGWVACEECDDTDASIHPAAVEICDGIDNDCNGDTDDADAALDLSTASTWYRDSDGDRYGDPGSSTRACVLPSGYLADNTDCDDASALVHPGAVEICNSIDDDCDLLVDDADSSLDTSSASAWYADSDADGFGDAGARTLSCTQPSGTVANDSDCDDGLATINPSATEICDLIDNDCDSNIDDADIDVVGRSTWYLDGDSDGYGGSTSTLSCFAPSGYRATGGDCNDGNAAIRPGATEICDLIDNDCDSLIDDADPGITGQSTWYRDADGDGYGSTTATRACTQPTGNVSSSTDCNDANAAVSPGATETCNHVDDDCDGSTDEGFDADSDGIVDCDEINYTITWTATGDDVWTGYIDGTSQGSFGGWNTTNTVTTTLNSGNHVLGAYVQDTGAAIAGWLSAVYVNGSRVSITGDGSWVYSTSGGSGWTTVAFNDSAWSTPAVCNASQVSSYWGSTPTALTGIGARWVWSSTNCTVLGSVYFRYEFNLP